MKDILQLTIEQLRAAGLSVELQDEEGTPTFCGCFADNELELSFRLWFGQLPAGELLDFSTEFFKPIMAAFHQKMREAKAFCCAVIKNSAGLMLYYTFTAPGENSTSSLLVTLKDEFFLTESDSGSVNFPKLSKAWGHLLWAIAQDPSLFPERIV